MKKNNGEIAWYLNIKRESCDKEPNAAQTQ